MSIAGKPSQPCGKCGHHHYGGPCREKVRELECLCWNWEPPHPPSPVPDDQDGQSLPSPLDVL
jgi:hypothetical protein